LSAPGNLWQHGAVGVSDGLNQPHRAPSRERLAGNGTRLAALRAASVAILGSCKKAATLKNASQDRAPASSHLPKSQAA